LVVEKIGEGQFGIVHKCKQLSTGNLVAVKRTKEKFEGAKDRFQKMDEVLKLFQLTHS